MRLEKSFSHNEGKVLNFEGCCGSILFEKLCLCSNILDTEKAMFILH